MEHAELIEGAFVNYLSEFLVAGKSPWPDGMDIFPGENNLDKSGQRIVCYIPSGDLGDEEPPLSGNRMTEVELQLRTPFSKLSAKEIAANAADPIDAHKAVAASLGLAVAALNDDLLSSAIASFTCMGIASRTATREQQDGAWVSGWKIKILSAPSAF